MIQELLGGSASTLGGERKLSLSGTLLEGSTSSSPSSSSPTTTAATATTSTTDQQNLRCPRCDSSNTKFCYYNNYNLTQPRHFCKTCRRYWTKGGALRNVPIGGGCRKNKNTSASTTAGKSNIGKVKTPSDIVRSSLGFDHEPASNPILWASSPQNSQLLTLLRATQNPNPNHISNSVGIKGEGNMIGSHMISDSAVVTGAFNARPISLDPLSQVPIGLCSSFWRNNQHQPQQHQQHQHHHHHHHHQQQQHQHQHNLLMGEPQNSGIQDLYQRLRTSSNYYTDHSQTVLSNVASTSSSSSAILESNTIAGGEMGYWNPAFSWPNLPTTNGAFP